MVLLVVVRDPTGKEPDDFFFTTDLEMAPAEVLSVYGDRWAIECTYRDVEQHAHGQEPQSWKGRKPERAANLAFWLHGAAWLWYLTVSGTTPVFTTRPCTPPSASPRSPMPSSSCAACYGGNEFRPPPKGASTRVKLQSCW